MIATWTRPLLKRTPSPIYRLIFTLLIRFVPAYEVDALLDMIDGNQAKVQRDDS